MSILLFVASATVVTTSTLALRSSSGASAYEQFRKEFGSDRPFSDTASYDARVALFEQRREQVRIHNAQPGISWTAAVNKFADYTEGEFNALLGHRSARHILPGTPSIGSMAPSSFLQKKEDFNKVPQEMDWSLNLTSASKIAKNQGGCGSCWAVAVAGALEVMAEAKHGKQVEVSYEELVDCVPNPEQCGGQGGCSGATAELAFEYVHKKGLAAKQNYKGYQHGGDGKCKSRGQSAIATNGFVRLPVNEQQPLLEALAFKGPVAVSADASTWSLYFHGVFDSCGKDAIINHAIVAIGFGTDKALGKDYWLIRNSWGSGWGESGFIRLLRSSESYCGVDNKPQDGVGCAGGPATLPVCGMCGVLSDSAYPLDVHVL